MRKNLEVGIKDDTITAYQKHSTPGVYKIFNLSPNTHYSIVLQDFDPCISKSLILWIATIDSHPIQISPIIGATYIFKFINKFHQQVKIGVLFKSHKLYDHFKLSDINISESTNVIPIINTKVNTNKETIVRKGISVVIPCHYKHLIFIEKLLQYYDKQTLLPLEIIIVISEIEKLKKPYEINKERKYEVNIVKVNGKSAAGNNRYLGAKNAQGDIIVFQDADDYPHHQRLEIIAHFFEKYPKIVHICHKFDYHEVTKDINIDEIKYEIVKSNKIFLIPSIRIPSRMTNGNVAIRKEIYNKVNWFNNLYRGQDVQFNNHIYNKYKQTLFIKESLYYYRKMLSVKNYVK